MSGALQGPIFVHILFKIVINDLCRYIFETDLHHLGRTAQRVWEKTEFKIYVAS